MNTRSPRSLLSIIVLSSAALLGAGCTTSTGQRQSVGAYVDDSVITTQVKAKFVEAKDVDASRISVETINGTVLLRGVAKNAQAKTEAESLARSVAGVRSVNNRIDVSAS